MKQIIIPSENKFIKTVVKPHIYCVGKHACNNKIIWWEREILIASIDEIDYTEDVKQFMISLNFLLSDIRLD